MRRKNTFKRKTSKRDSAFINIGSITAAKSWLTDGGDPIEDREELLEALLAEKAQLWVKVYLPKGVKSVNLRKDDRILLSFTPHDEAPDFVLGNARMENES